MRHLTIVFRDLPQETLVQLTSMEEARFMSHSDVREDVVVAQAKIADLERQLSAARKDASRYEVVRKLSISQLFDLHRENIESDVCIDVLVDRMICGTSTEPPPCTDLMENATPEQIRAWEDYYLAKGLREGPGLSDNMERALNGLAEKTVNNKVDAAPPKDEQLSAEYLRVTEVRRLAKEVLDSMGRALSGATENIIVSETSSVSGTSPVKPSTKEEAREAFYVVQYKRMRQLCLAFAAVAVDCNAALFYAIITR